MAVAGRQPELLSQWAQAQYFADGKKWSDKVQALTDEALKLDPKEVTSLGLLGIVAFEGERYQEAIDYWRRLLAQLPEGEKNPVRRCRAASPGPPRSCKPVAAAVETIELPRSPFDGARIPSRPADRG
nr:hypothetical protein GCM10020185_88550 [Pseudomonas brassicacearum subsp. brassicacearum]